MSGSATAAVQEEPSVFLVSSRQAVAFDYESKLIGPGAVFPEPMCWTAAWRPDPNERSRPPRMLLVSNGDGEGQFWGGLERLIDRCLETEAEVVFHNGPGFDLPVAALWRPSLMSKIFRMLEAGLVRDTMLREKLLNLATHGFVDKFYTPDGKGVNISYSLERLVLKYLGFDRHAGKGEEQKKGTRIKVEDGKVSEWEGEQKRKQGIWRFNFDALDRVPSSQYPAEARDYAVLDTHDTLLVREAQDALAREKFTDRGASFPDGTPFDVFRTEPLHNGAKFALSLMTHWGFGVDPVAVKHMEEQVQRALAPERTKLLYESGLLAPALPARPQTRKTRDGRVVEVIDKKTGKPKMLKPRKEKLSKKKLVDLVQAVWLKNAFCDEKTCSRFGKQCDEHGLPVLKKTEPSGKFPDGQISTDGEVISDLAPFDPILDQYDNRSQVQKLTTLYIPMLNSAIEHGGVIHAGFDDLKRTGRTSSRATKSYPSFNAQQVPRGFVVEYPQPDGTFRKEKIEPRLCLVPRNKGWLIASVDFSYVELVTLASQLYKALGYSVLREKINADLDPHAFFGSQLAYHLHQEFNLLCTEVLRHRGSAAGDPIDEIYQTFVSLKKGSAEEKDFYKKYRNFAKPCTLGYPGGLGAKTLIAYAWGTFGVRIASVEQAKQFKEVLLRVFPEIAEYLGNRGYIMREFRDEIHSKPDDDRFACFTPSGMYRSNCSYTSVANSFGLQAPAGEGGKIACFNVTRACFDPEMRSCLYGCRPMGFVHDELLVETPDDAYSHERAWEISRIMVDSMRVITPDVKVKAEPCLMRRWDKNAEYVTDANGRLKVWEPGK